MAASTPSIAPTPSSPRSSGTCADSQKNQDETGADCGGSSCAARCGVGKGCKAQTDCEDGLICEEVWLRCDDGGGGFPWLPVFVCLFLLVIICFIFLWRWHEKHQRHLAEEHEKVMWERTKKGLAKMQACNAFAGTNRVFPLSISPGPPPPDGDGDAPPPNPWGPGPPEKNASGDSDANTSTEATQDEKFATKDAAESAIMSAWGRDSARAADGLGINGGIRQEKEDDKILERVARHLLFLLHLLRV